MGNWRKGGRQGAVDPNLRYRDCFSTRPLDLSTTSPSATHPRPARAPPHSCSHHVVFFNCFHHERPMRQTVENLKRVIGNRGLGLVMHGAQNHIQ